MILVDTSVWIDHFRLGDAVMARLLENGLVLTHPFVVGELALGSLRQRKVVLDALLGLPGANVADNDEVLAFIEREKLFAVGIGYVDAHLLVATRLTANASLWTRDKTLAAAAAGLSLAAHALR